MQVQSARIMATIGAVLSGVIIVVVVAVVLGELEIGPDGRLLLLVTAIAAVAVIIIAVIQWRLANLTPGEPEWAGRVLGDIEQL